MKNGVFLHGIGGILFLFCTVILASPVVEPQLTKEELISTRALPYGISGQASLLIRKRHVNSVHYLGSGIQSQYGYSRYNGLLPTSLWVRLLNRGQEAWSHGSVVFRKPLQTNRYNSLVLWIRSNQPNVKFWLELQDETWDDLNEIQARTDILPSSNYPANQIVQVVIPFRAIYPNYPLDYSQISRISIEFGEDTVGNSQGQILEILGLSFVSQDKPVSYVRLISDKPLTVVKKNVKSPSTKTTQVKKISLNQKKLVRRKKTSYMIEDRKFAQDNRKKVFFGSDYEGVSVFRKPMVQSKKIYELKEGVSYMATDSVRVNGERWFSLVVSDSKRGWVRGEDLLLKGLGFAGNVPEKPKIVKRVKLNPMSVKKGMKPTHPQVEETKNELLAYQKKGETFIVAAKSKLAYAMTLIVSNIKQAIQNVGLWAFSFVLIIGLWLGFHKGRKWARPKSLKTWFEIKWPFKTSEWIYDGQVARSFWRKLGSSGVDCGWLSTNDVPLRKDSVEEYYGENFLAKQISFARREGIQVIPSLCFVRTVFNYDTFLSHPDLFLYKPVPANENRLSDEELRIKYIGFFPIWVPPFWQKQHDISQRVLVAYGKMPGASFTSDSAQYNLASPKLRQMAIHVLKRFARITPAVRIEGALAMLSTYISLYWDGVFNSGEFSGTKEFWREVIDEVKKSYPNFVFISDDVGADSRVIRSLGFDYFENDHIKEILTNQIRLETVGNLKQVFTSRSSGDLNRSLFNLTSLLKPTKDKPSSTCQNQIAATLLSLMPGKITYENDLWPEFGDFLHAMAKYPAIQKGSFIYLETGKPEVFSFARLYGKNLVIVVANFLMAERAIHVDLAQFMDSFVGRKLYLFNDVLHGKPFLREIKDNQVSGPAMPVWGQDIRERGLPIKLPGLSLKIFSVDLTRAHERRPAQIKDETLVQTSK